MESIGKVVLVSGLTLAATFLLQPYRPVVISGRSMAPTLQSGEIMVSAPLNREPRVGDIVLVDRDGATLVKRVAMVPGDKYQEAYIRYAHTWTMVKTEAQKRMVAKGIVPVRERTIPDGFMYILGDNLNVSVDSRTFGLVPIGSIRGVVFPFS